MAILAVCGVNSVRKREKAKSKLSFFFFKPFLITLGSLNFDIFCCPSHWIAKVCAKFKYMYIYIVLFIFAFRRE